MRILVTGATGFVGSHALEALMQHPEAEVIAACRDKTRLIPEFEGEVRDGDLRDEQYTRSLVQGVDVLVHAAAWSSLWGHRQESEELFLKPSLNLYRMALATGVGRILNISSTSAAAPVASESPVSRGIPRKFWPHLTNVIRLEEYLRNHVNGHHRVAVNLRLGIFAGRRYSLGVLPILLPRLRTNLVPWVSGGRTHLPLIDGRDIGQAIARASLTKELHGYEAFNIVGPEVPTVREVISFLHQEYGVPKPKFSVPFAVAYPFAWLMEKFDPFVPADPLVTRSIIHLLEETRADNRLAAERLGYQPKIHWKEAIRVQMEEMRVRQKIPMPMTTVVKPRKNVS